MEYSVARKVFVNPRYDARACASFSSRVYANDPSSFPTSVLLLITACRSRSAHGASVGFSKGTPVTTPSSTASSIVAARMRLVSIFVNPAFSSGAPVMSTLDNYSRLVSVRNKAIGDRLRILPRKNGRWLICP